MVRCRASADESGGSTLDEMKKWPPRKIAENKPTPPLRQSGFSQICTPLLPGMRETAGKSSPLAGVGSWPLHNVTWVKVGDLVVSERANLAAEHVVCDIAAGRG